MDDNIPMDAHQLELLKWSAIAARLPGRTDNEIKNVWHTHLKKRLPRDTERKPNWKQMQSALDAQKYSNNNHDPIIQEQEPVTFPTHHVIKAETREERPQCSSSDMSTLTTSDSNDRNSNLITRSTINRDMSMNNSAESLDNDFWSEVLSGDNSNETSSFPAVGVADLKFHFPFSPKEGVHLAGSSSLCDSMDHFWYDVYTKPEEFPEL